MKKLVIVFVAIFCVHGVALAQQKLKFFKSDNAFYLDNNRLLEKEVRKILRSNPSALESWERGNSMKSVNAGMKISTGVLIGIGGTIAIVSFGRAIALMPLYILGYTDNTEAWLAAGLILCGAGIVTGIMIPITKTKYQSHYSDAAKIYNKGLPKTAVSLQIGATSNGLGFSLKF